MARHQKGPWPQIKVQNIKKTRSQETKNLWAFAQKSSLQPGFQKTAVTMQSPLTGIRVVDLTQLLPGPLCSQHLADLGAEVIKIENPKVADATRLWGEKIKKNGYEESYMFLLLNRNKKSITLNIKRERGREILFKLLEKADVLLEGFRAGTMDELGLGYESLKEKFPRLVYCAISGYGANGPYKNLAGHDANFLARSGLLSLNGAKDGPPILPGFQVADIGGGTLVALAGILAALYAREKTGRGQFVDVSMLDGAFNFLHLYAANFLATQKNPKRGDEVLSGKLPNYSVYQTMDGRYVMLAALEERFFRTFLRQIGKEDILEGKNFHEERDLEKIRQDLMDFFSKKTMSELEPLFNMSDTCLSPVNELSDAFEDPQLKSRGLIIRLKHPKLGEYTTIGSPFVFSETKVGYRLHPPAIGEHTMEILKELGYSEGEIEDLRKNRVI